jgi:hypothetical protein
MTDDQRITRLIAQGYVVLYNGEIADGLADLGARLALATPGPDGAHWPMVRAIRTEDGLARFALEDDVQVFSTLHEALRNIDQSLDAKPGSRHRETFHLLRELLRSRGYTPEQFAAFETVVRLGSKNAVLAFLRG